MLLLFATSFSVSHGLSEPITTGSLVKQMIDLHRLADFTNPAYKTVQFSSYDHRSSLPGGPNWFANSDGFGREPIPNFEGVIREPDENGIGEYLICNVHGPGAIVRVWTANIDGSIRMFLDDAVDPVYDGPAADFLLRTYHAYAKAAKIKDSVFDGTFQQRNAGYYPIPFAKRCRLVWIGNVNKIHFYQIQIRLYAPGTEVVPFQPEELKTNRKEIREVAKVLSDPDNEWVYSSSHSPVPIAATIAPKEVQEILKLEGSKAIERLSLKVYASNLDKALRQTILHIVCDDYPWGQVQAPIGDFFGAAPGINPFNSVPFTVRPDGTMICRFVMPFAKSLRILIDNRGEQPVTVTGSALPMDYAWDNERSMHFRARWRVDHNLVASNRAVQDMPYLVANGQGVYVGTATMLMNPNPVPTSGGNWWGEGDEKIFVDGDFRPSTFGTGSEDYYNYAWSSSDIFLYPYCGQPRNDGPANRGFVTNHRWHILDCLPFQQRISFYMELFSHERTPGVSYARISYHYGRPGIMDDHLPITDEDVRFLELPPNWQPAARGAARNSIFYQAEELVQGEASLTFAEDNIWSGGRLLVWHPARKGDKLVLTVPVLEDGKHAIHLMPALNKNSGRISVRLDGDKAGFGGDKEIIDLFVPHRTLLRHYASKTLELSKGEHVLTLRCEGPSKRGTGNTVGVDFIWVQKK